MGTDPLPTGKIPPALLREVLAAAARSAPEVRLGPAPGEDACAIEVPAGVLVAATDPITLTSDAVGAHSVVINANDVAVMGVRPRWYLAVVLVPPGADAAGVRALFAGMGRALDALGVVLVGGHTEVTPAVRQPVVIGQMLGTAADGRFVSTGGARPGDAVVQVSPAPVEAAGVLAAERASALEALAPELQSAARDALERPGIAVVEPALAAAELGATALHDPTEGGLATGLRELAEASGVGMRVEPERVIWFEPGRALCTAVGADPWGSLASGCLLAAFPSERLSAVLDGLARRGHEAAAIGSIEVGAGVRDEEGRELPRFDRDEVARVLSAPGE